MGIAAREHEDLASPMPRHLNGQMRRGTEAKQSQPLPGPHAREPQRAIPNDAGAQQRGGVRVVERPGQRIHVVGPRHQVLRVSPVHVIAGEHDLSAQVLFTTPAGFAHTA